MIISIVDFVVSHNLDQLAWPVIFPYHFHPDEKLQSYDNIIRYKISWSEMRSELIMKLSYGAFLSSNFKKYFLLTLIRFPTAISITIIQLVAINNCDNYYNHYCNHYCNHDFNHCYYYCTNQYCQHNFIFIFIIFIIMELCCQVLERTGWTPRRSLMESNIGKWNY